MKMTNDATSRRKAIAILGAVFPKFTPTQAQAYDEFLSDIPAILIEKSIKQLILTAKFPPTVAEIRETAEKIYRTANGERQPDAGRSWGEVLKAIDKYGWNEPHFDDPLTEEAVKRFGWHELGMQPVDSISVARGQYMKIYNMLAERRKEDRKLHMALSDGKVLKLVESIAEKKAIERKAPEEG